MFFRKSIGTSELKMRRIKISCWLMSEMLECGKPINFDLLREKITQLNKPGDRTIARNMANSWEAEAIAQSEQKKQIETSHRIHNEKLTAWLSILPVGAQYTKAQRGGYVAVLDNKLIARFDGESSEGGDGFNWYGCPYIESSKRPLSSVANRLATAS